MLPSSAHGSWTRCDDNSLLPLLLLITIYSPIPAILKDHMYLREIIIIISVSDNFQLKDHIFSHGIKYMQILQMCSSCPWHIILYFKTKIVCPIINLLFAYRWQSNILSQGTIPRKIIRQRQLANNYTTGHSSEFTLDCFAKLCISLVSYWRLTSFRATKRVPLVSLAPWRVLHKYLLQFPMPIHLRISSKDSLYQ